MESIDLEMDDLFDRDAGTLEEEIEGDLNAPPAFPDLDTDDPPMAAEDGANNTSLNDDDGEGAQLSRLRDLSKGAAKKRVQRPQPKLDAARLKSDRGLPALTQMFKDVNFKGKGNEARDLKLMMDKMEHWAHRLFPKIPFDEFIERMEKLGTKKDVQNCVKRIRLDMPILDVDYVTQYDDGEPEKENVDGEEGAAAAAVVDDEVDADQAFEDMMRRENEAFLREKKQLEEETGTAVASTSRGGDLEEPGTSQSGAPDTPAPAKSPKPAQTPGSMSAEQKERMERNKMVALKKRAARLGVPVSQLMSPKPSSPKSRDASQSDSPEKTQGNLSNVETDEHTKSSQETDIQMETSQGTEEHRDEDDFRKPLDSQSSLDDDVKSANKPAKDPEVSDDQQTEEELMLALELDTDESFSKENTSQSDTAPSPAKPSQHGGDTMSEEFSVIRKTVNIVQQSSGGNDGDMSEEFSVIQKQQAQANSDETLGTETVPEMSEEFPVIHKQSSKGVLQKGTEDMDTEEMSEVLVVRNNNVSKCEATEEHNKLSETEAEQIESFTEMESESVPLI